MFRIVVALSILASPLVAQPLTLEDRGSAVTFPLGAASFADFARVEVPGDPAAASPLASRPEAMTGAPDYAGGETEAVTLGCRGSVVARFDDNVLIDVDGPDLYVFEVGPDVEPMELAVSEDGASWIGIGRIEGGTASVDLAGLVPEGAAFRFVRLTDGGAACGSATPGADIDALGAIGAAAREETEEPAEYDDGRGGTVTFSGGAISFADEVVLYAPGGRIPREDAADPFLALGAPDYDGGVNSGFTTLGCGGVGVWRFVDNVLVDVPGPDLFVFEVGPDVEGTSVAISADGVTWTEIGAIEGATAEIDIAPHAAPGEIYAYVRLTDDGVSCSGRWPGADIDAIGALGTGRRIVLDASVLFDVDSAVLGPDAVAALSGLLGRMTDGPIRVVVQGHTDADGSDAYNLDLSRARAEAVGDWLGVRGPHGMVIETVGHGEARPVASNDEAEGKALNRRVEIVIVGR